MNSLESLTAFFGWCSVLSIGILCLSSIGLILMRSRISRIHSRMFGMSEQDLARAYFQYLAQFKIAVIMLNLVPYMALRLMA
ncbi:MAG: hypothetical protein R3F13_21340 [Prosthecobacter sp.]